MKLIGFIFALCAGAVSATEYTPPFATCPNGIRTTVEALDGGQGYDVLFWYGSLTIYCQNEPGQCNQLVTWIRIDNVTGTVLPLPTTTYPYIGFQFYEPIVVSQIDFDRCIALFEWSNYGAPADEIYNDVFGG